MKTVETIIRQLTGRNQLMQDIRDMLLQIDPQFPAAEKQYADAAAKLREAWSDAEEYLAAREACFTAAMIYMAWQGFQLNVDTFQHPIHSLLLHGDFDQLCQEERVATLPEYSQAQSIVSNCHRTLPGEIRGLILDISEYYAHLETVGYKTAHYFGYRFADRFLRHVIPGYVTNPANSEHYRITLSQYLQIDLRQLDR